MKKQILVIHGGTNFSSYDAYLENLKTSEIKLDRLRFVIDWKKNLQNHLGE
ncbi:hypothetical protein GW764_02190 [Candidatus Parcubacteria bacterium]|nr:hypothetical protein [Candidatus Parcubacteria bacterium]